MDKHEAELKFRKQLKEDFKFWAERFCKIRTKDGEVRPLVLNTVQIKLLDAIEDQLQKTGRIRVIILKARQQGLSTFVSAYLYWRLSHRKARKGFVVAHVAKSTQSLFDMYKRVHKDLPDQLRQTTRYASRSEIVFDKLDTALAVATAGGDAIGRGETITDAHLSEVAFWPSAHASNNLNALSQAIPNTADTSIFVESTADGVSGPFYELWQGATEGKNGFLPFFSPWFDSAEYRKDDEPFPAAGLWIEEEDLVRDHGLTWPQLAWRREKIALNGAEKFRQEYPATAKEAFVTSGFSIFDPVKIDDALNEVEPPVATRHMIGQNWPENRFGELSVWHEPEIGEDYWIGADVASGTGKDYSVAQVLDSNKRQVAVWRGKIDVRGYADVLFALGLRYNNAKVCVERNNHGFTVLMRLQHDLLYENLYTDVDYGKITELPTEKLGFFTNAQSKPMLIHKLVESLRTGEIKFNHADTLREMQTFVEHDNGSFAAASGKFDDCVMSLAIANHIHDGHWQPVPQDLIEEFYVEPY